MHPHGSTTGERKATTHRRIVLLNRFYWPDVAATGQMLTDLAEDLAADGWDVTVVTGMTGYAAAGGELPREERRNGVRIVRVRTTRFGRGLLIGRFADSVSYVLGAFWRLVRLPRPEAVVPLSDPPFLLAPVLLVGRVRGYRTIYWPQDLYPHLAGRLGVLREGGLAYRLADGIARLLHSAVDGVITLGPAMTRTLVASGAPAGRTTHVHNWADARAVHPVRSQENPFVQAQGLAGKFVVLYSGNAGRAHEFGAVTESMRRLRDDPGVVFVFIGGGPRLPEIRSEAERHGLTNVRFLDYLPREQIKYSLSAASLSLVTESPQVLGLLVPSKTYGILASGRPLLFVGSAESDVARVVRDARCGMIISPEDPDALVAAIRHMRDHPVEAEAMGRRGREAAEQIYDRRHATRRWARVLRALLEERDPTCPLTRDGDDAGYARLPPP